MNFKRNQLDLKSRTSQRTKTLAIPPLRCHSRYDKSDEDEFIMQPNMSSRRQQVESLYKMGTDVRQFGFQHYNQTKKQHHKNQLSAPDFKDIISKESSELTPLGLQNQRKSKLDDLSQRFSIKKSTRKSNYDVDFHLTQIMKSHLITRHQPNPVLPPNFQLQLGSSRRKAPYNIRESFLNYQLQQESKRDQLDQVEESQDSINTSLTSIDILNSGRMSKLSKFYVQSPKSITTAAPTMPEFPPFRDENKHKLKLQIKRLESIMVDEVSPKTVYSPSLFKTTR